MIKRYTGEDIEYKLDFDRTVNTCLEIVARIVEYDAAGGQIEIAKYSHPEKVGYFPLTVTENSISAWLYSSITSPITETKNFKIEGYLIDEALDFPSGEQKTYFEDPQGFNIVPTDSTDLINE